MKKAMRTKTKTPAPSLTLDDCAEIYYALLSKFRAVETGAYDPEDRPGQNLEWLRDLNDIIEKIGPDGVNLYHAQEGAR